MKQLSDVVLQTEINVVMAVCCPSVPFDLKTVGYDQTTRRHSDNIIMFIITLVRASQICTAQR